MLGIFFAGIFTLFAINTEQLPSEIKYIEHQYPADFSNDQILVGASHNIFVGTVVKKLGTKERESVPETQFQVEIVDNIKGNLKESIIVNQEGGYRLGALYVVGEENPSTQKSDEKNSYLLTPGSTYLFVTRYNPEEDWYTLNSHPAGLKLLTNSVLEPEQLRKLVAEDERVQALKKAYPNEILIKADVATKNTRNSFVSRDEKQEAIADSQEVIPAVEEEILEDDTATVSESSN